MVNSMYYNREVERMRRREYPMLKDVIYLDHAGTTLYAKSLIERFSKDMIMNLYGNPHSSSASSQLSTNRIEETRSEVLKFFKADPEYFDVVFVANATAGIKLVMDAFRDKTGFTYCYHRDSHTSLVGVREVAAASCCVDDESIEHWLASGDNIISQDTSFSPTLFAYPAQSNLNGRRLPLSWPKMIRQAKSTQSSRTYTLLDVSALVSTSQLDLSDPDAAADFTILSFYKIFGFPDLGALIVRKETGTILRQRKYFGGGTVDMVIVLYEQWHALKTESLHDILEDGTLPFHNIIALRTAMDVHKRLYGSMDRIAKHTAFLAKKLYLGLDGLRYKNEERVCVIYSHGFSNEDFSCFQGPVVAFNIRDRNGAWVSNSRIMELATASGIHIRTGGLCNPGGIATFLDLEPEEMRSNFAAGFRCGGEEDIFNEKITGVVRASLGAMSTLSDVETFISFVKGISRRDLAQLSYDTSVLRGKSEEPSGPEEDGLASCGFKPSCVCS